MIAMAEAWVKKYPIVSWEDPLAENDWEGFRKFTERLGGKIEIVGDDLFVTNTKYYRPGYCGKIRQRRADQAEPDRHRHPDDRHDRDVPRRWLALHAVASPGRDRGQLSGRLRRRHERRSDQDRLRVAQRAIAKYNRLLEIEADMGGLATYYWQ